MYRLFCVVLVVVITTLPAMADESGSMFSPEIRQEAQEALSYYGYADGRFGSRTHRAISAYQTATGDSPTGEFSRAGLGNLLQRYREDRRREMNAATKTGLPEPVLAEIAGMANNCGTTPEVIAKRSGYLQEADLNNDGIVDYLLDGSAADCSTICGAANCQVTVIVSTSRGYRQNDFLGGSVSPSSFNCLSDGYCEFAR